MYSVHTSVLQEVKLHIQGPPLVWYVRFTTVPCATSGMCVLLLPIISYYTYRKLIAHYYVLYV